MSEQDQEREQDCPLFELHVISTNRGEKEVMLKAAKQIWPYVHYIHIREKHLSLYERYNWAKLMAESGIPSSRIVINGAKRAAPGDIFQGIHWSQDMLERAKLTVKPENKHDLRLRLGISVHSLHEAKIAEEYGADYLFFGHVYASASKPDVAARGLDALAEVCSSVKVPVIAIGGIQPCNIRAVRSAGAGGAAVISSVLKHANPGYAAALLKQAVEA
ncbi:thiazole tautomerase TenI [Paenibacillus amylolyticus]|jgi:thiazole tautomerase (transcriptional regulator TenI)|uniref:Thiazole tautomerase TenI n=1 Tax=Paenibacillus amylolyticus TaxID=1451 RepID=A0A5M9WWS8_PAEAM|nr:thiamine phosphate synthase [Paenibacillus amylolyticus]KAA8785972.1 thiazole tautomerase TenI [Paenibacillus amylolyticus]